MVIITLIGSRQCSVGVIKQSLITLDTVIGTTFYTRGYPLGYCIAFVIPWCVYFHTAMMSRVTNEMGRWDGPR